jgi:hypothetical protein
LQSPPPRPTTPMARATRKHTGKALALLISIYVIPLTQDYASLELIIGAPEVPMRSHHHIVAIAVVFLVVGVGVTMFLFSQRGAQASLETPTNARTTVLRMQNDINLLR